MPKFKKGEVHNPRGRKLSGPEREARLLLQRIIPDNVRTLLEMAVEARESGDLKLAAWIRVQLHEFGAGKTPSAEEATRLNQRARDEEIQALDEGDMEATRIAARALLERHPHLAEAFVEEGMRAQGIDQMALPSPRAPEDRPDE